MVILGAVGVLLVLMVGIATYLARRDRRHPDGERRLVRGMQVRLDVETQRASMGLRSTGYTPADRDASEHH